MNRMHRYHCGYQCCPYLTKYNLNHESHFRCGYILGISRYHAMYITDYFENINNLQKTFVCHKLNYAYFSKYAFHTYLIN